MSRNQYKINLSKFLFIKFSIMAYNAVFIGFFSWYPFSVDLQ